MAVVRADGALGYAPNAPYDRVIATVGARDVPLAWQDQLAPGGRIVVPLRLRGGVTRSVAFRRVPEAGPALRSDSSVMCGFMPMRASISSDPRHTLPLTPTGDVLLDVQQEQFGSVDPDALKDVLDTEPASVRTGVRLRDVAATEWLYLWLACTLSSGLFMMQVRQSAVDAGIVGPILRWGTVGTAEGASLAYLTFGPVREVGVIGHGPRGRDLAEMVSGRVRDWDAAYRTRTAEFEIWPARQSCGGAPPAREDTFVFPTPSNTLVVSWRHESENLTPHY